MRYSGQQLVNPLTDIGNLLLTVEKPSRYLGGEANSVRKYNNSLLSIALCFPDLYEIGMSNNAMGILYSGLNAMPGVRAERVFAPAPDFESLLDKLNFPLYTLETGMSIADVDILGLSLGYELAATSIITVLKSGRIPLRSIDRDEKDPIVIMGGPAATNPHPFSTFIDVAFIGEAEAGFFDLAEELSGLKRAGARRADLLDRLRQVDAVWFPNRDTISGKRALRSVFQGFSLTKVLSALPLPTVKIVQDHGSVEIMRGCPNGCRFCHAGFFYRPQRIKPYEIIRSEVESLIKHGGYREITLSSLSSGDFPGVGELLDKLNAEWGSRNVSFQLPSLKVNSFTLPIIRKLAEVRKSGLTFAIETPVDEWQQKINKNVSFEKTIKILEEARSVGFKQAKFYFMIGLPVPGRGIGEAEAILDFFARIRSKINIQINVNVGTFVPKPHTPFQWSPQLHEEEALETINCIRNGLRKYKNFKFSYHSPFNSQIEGIIARGDERVGELILSAHLKGARMDAWEEHFDRELWRTVISEAKWPVINENCSSKSEKTPLIWDDIGMRVSKSFLWREYSKSLSGETTSTCVEKCTELCGSCNDEIKITDTPDPKGITEEKTESREMKQKPSGRLVFRFSKTLSASFMQHLSIVDAFIRAFQMSGLSICFSEGFNPMPRFETSQPIPIAVDSKCEIASIILSEEVDRCSFISMVNNCLPIGLYIEDAHYFPIIEGKKQRTIGSLEWGSEYEVRYLSPPTSTSLFQNMSAVLKDHSIPDFTIEPTFSGGVLVRLPMPTNKDYSLLRILESCSEIRPIQMAFKIMRTQLFAYIGDEGLPISFFQAYESVS